MKRDDVRTIFPEATDEQVDAFLNKVGSEINPLKSSVADLGDRLETANAALTASVAEKTGLQARVDELSAKVEEGMTAEERIAAREKAAADKEREFLIKSAELDAKAIFVEAGFAEDDIEALLPRVVSADAEATRQAAQSLVDFDSRRREKAEQETKDAVLKQNPKLAGSGGSGGVSRDEFARLTFEEQRKLVEENPGLLGTLTTN